MCCLLARKKKRWDMIAKQKVSFLTTTRTRLNINLRGCGVEYVTTNTNELERSILLGNLIVDGKITNFGDKVNVTLNLPNFTKVTVKLEKYEVKGFEVGYTCYLTYLNNSLLFTVRGAKLKANSKTTPGRAKINLIYF